MPLRILRILNGIFANLSFERLVTLKEGEKKDRRRGEKRGGEKEREKDLSMDVLGGLLEGGVPHAAEAILGQLVRETEDIVVS